MKEEAGKLSEADFWSLIEQAKNKSEDVDEQAERLAELLSNRPVEDIIQFHLLFERLHTMSYQSRLWAAAYLINGGCSDDGFDYFRGWLIAQGKEVFYKSLENPDSLASFLDEDEIVESEDMLSVASVAFQKKTRKKLDDFYALLPASAGVPAIELDWEEDEEEKFHAWFPKLSEKFS